MSDGFFLPPWSLADEENKDKTDGWIEFQKELIKNPEYLDHFNRRRKMGEKIEYRCPECGEVLDNDERVIMTNGFFAGFCLLEPHQSIHFDCYLKRSFDHYMEEKLKKNLKLMDSIPVPEEFPKRPLPPKE